LKKEQVLWPDHCVQNTNGAALAPELKLPSDAVEILKGTQPESEFYSAFADIWGEHPTKLEALLREKGITDVYVVGIAKDYCVLNTAIDSAKLGWSTFVIDEATRPVSAADEPKTEARYRENGVHVISYDSDTVKQLRSVLA
jgi:nicotinamidase-related amidase